MKTVSVLIIAIVSQAIGNVYLTKAMKAVTTPGASDDLMIAIISTVAVFIDANPDRSS